MGLASQNHVGARKSLVRTFKLIRLRTMTNECRYVREDVTNAELQALSEQTYSQLLEWRCNLPPELSLDTSAPEITATLPHILVLQ